jgi:acetyl-CoA decarbonylase/synthase complex subunit gamma
MALTGLDIYRQLPKTNCKKCGFPTCLAFAMQIAAKKASLDKCPDLTAEAKAALEGVSAPPIQLVSLGAGENKLEIGNETVMFRHEQTFHHPPGVGVEVSDELSLEELKDKVKQINALNFQRVGEQIKVEVVAVNNKSQDKEKFVKTIQTIITESNLILVLISSSPQILEEGLKICAEKRPLIYAATSENYSTMVELAKKYQCPLAVKGKNLEELTELTPKITSQGVKELVIDSGEREPQKVLFDLTQIRRLALKKTYRPLGFPAITFVEEKGYPAVLTASTYVAKYSGLIILSEAEAWQILPLLTLRQNIYTDPQKPIQVEPKVYEIGAVSETSPILITSNFSLTYFTVEGDVEASKVPSYILVIDTEGMSVLTAFAADKFTPAKIKEALLKNKFDQKVAHKKVIIPGYVAVLSGQLEEETGWEVMVGPRESSSLPAYLKNVWAG